MGNFRYFVVGLVLLFASQMALAQLESVVDQGVGPAWLAPGDTEVTQEVVLTDSDAPQTASVTVTRVQVENVIGTAVASDFAKIEILINGEKRGEVNQPFTFPVWIDITDFEIPDDRSATLEVRVTVSSGIIGHRTIQTRVTIEHREEGETYYATRDDLTPTTINNYPVAQDDGYTTPEDTALVVPAPGVLGNDTDVDRDILQAVLSEPSRGTLVLNPDGSLTYTPEENFWGQDSFTYKVLDPSEAESNVATVTITVTAVDDPVDAVDDSYTTSEDMTLTVSAPGVLENDSYPDGFGSLDVVTEPENGSVTLNEDGSFTYTPNPNFHGTDSFVYRLTDDDGDSDTATVTITVNPVNDPPVANDDTATTDEDTSVEINVLDNDTDVDDTLDPTTVTITVPPQHGSVSVNTTTGVVTYTPAGDYYGPDSFKYTVKDNGGATSNAATVTITVNPVPFTALRTPPVGWNLCSAPLKPIPPNDTPAAVIGDDISPLFIYWWDPNATPPGYITPSSLDPGRGYWVYIMTEGITVDVTGTRIDHDYQVPLGKAGWHMISTPTVNVYWGYCKFTDGTDTKTYDEAIEAGWIAPFLYQWDPYTNAYKSFTAQGVIEPWVGYWIRTYHDGLTLILPVEQAIKNPPPPPSSSNLGPSAAELGLTPPAPPTLPMMDKKTGLVVLNYPNPVRDVRTTKFMVLGAEVETIRVSVYDLTGRLVWRGEGAGNELTWHTDDLSGQFLANGVYLYIVEVKVGGQWIRSEVKRLVILR